MAAIVRLYVGGRIKGTEWDSLASHYLKQMRRWRVEVIEPTDAQWAKLTRATNEYWVALAADGTVMDSPQFADKMALWEQQPQILSFLIGQAWGFPDHVLPQAQVKIALGPMVWPHLLARLMLIEQLYRAQSHLAGHPYSTI